MTTKRRPQLSANMVRGIMRTVRKIRREATLSAMDKDLAACGWISCFNKDFSIAGFKDPLTGQIHRTDFAWFIQSEGFDGSCYQVQEIEEMNCPTCRNKMTEAKPYHPFAFQFSCGCGCRVGVPGMAYGTPYHPMKFFRWISRRDKR